MSYGINAPTGLKELCSITGAQWSSKANVYRLSASADGVTTYANSMFKGDPVVINALAANQGGGTVGVYVPIDDGTDARNAVPVLGRLSGISYTSVGGLPIIQDYWIGGTHVQPNSDIIAWVIDDPDAVFTIQVSSMANVLNNAVFTRDKVFQNFGFGVAGGGNIVVNPASGIYSGASGQSVFYLNGVFTANPGYVAATLPLKVRGYDLNAKNLDQPRTYSTGTTQPYLNLQVMINNHFFRPGALGIVAV